MKEDTTVLSRVSHKKMPKKRMSMKTRESIEGFAFIAPAVIHLVIFVVIPVIGAFVLSFQEWSILTPEKHFVGLGNYFKLLR